MPLPRLDMRPSWPTKAPTRVRSAYLVTAFRQTARPVADAAIPERPGPSVLNEVIPLFFIGRNKDGFWVARDADGMVGGIFLRRRSALRFAKNSSQPAGCATMLVPERFELDVENRGNSLAVRLGPARRMALHLALRLRRSVNKLAATGRVLALRFSRAFADERKHRAAIERELFQGRYKLSSKNDDDLPVVR
jgi:hypothetical protein